MRYTEAVLAEPTITVAVVAVASSAGATVEGLDFRIKGMASYERKMALDPSAELRDVIRYTYTAPAGQYVGMIDKSMALLKEQGYETIRVKNYWNRSKNPYSGVNTFVQSTEGQVFELQYHTPESFALKNGELHTLYEKQRVLTDTESVEYTQLSREMAELSSALEMPKGIEEVPDL